MADRYEDQYRRDRGYRRDDRGLMDRAGDEVRSWFGDDDAERRRQMDSREGGDYGRQSSGYDSRYNPGGSGDRSYAYGDRSHGGDRSSGYGSGDRSGYGYGSGDRSGYGDRSYGSSGSGASGNYGSGGYGSSSGYGSGNYGASGNYGSGSGASGRSGSSGGYGSQGGFQDRGSENRGGMGWFSGRGPKGYQRSDARINEDVCDRLCDSAEIDASNLEVRVESGQVTLSGTVSDREQKRRAEDLIEQVSGVREVHNNLRVSQDTGSAGTSSGSTSDSSTTTSGSSAGASTTAEQPGNVLGVTGAPDRAASTAGRR